MKLIESYQEIDEENRLQSTLARKVEYLTTIDVLNKYCSGSKKCIDVGCGVGIYALYLDRIGIQTTAIDIVPDHIKRLKEIISRQNSNIDAHIGNALDLSAYKSDTYDIVLCLGPLYHLITSEDQNKCINECKRLVNSDGVLLFSYISPYSVFPCAIRGDSKRMSTGLIDKIVIDHKIEADSPYCFWTDNYYHDPTEIESLLNRHGLEIVDHLATDGQSIAFQSIINQMTEDQFSIWMNYHFKTCRVRTMLGASNHGLVVARKKV